MDSSAEQSPSSAHTMSSRCDENPTSPARSTAGQSCVSSTLAAEDPDLTPLSDIPFPSDLLGDIPARPDTSEAFRNLKYLCLYLRKSRHDQDTIDRFRKLDSFLLWLSSTVTRSPQLSDAAAKDVHKILEVVSDQEQWKFPAQYARYARALFAQWEAINWGKVVRTVNEQESSTPTLRSGNIFAVTAAKGEVVKSVPDGHRIWGKGGIMYGGALSAKGSFVLRQDLQKRDFKVHGHNELVVGRWWPNQLLALAHGAHGASQGGISGSTRTGAWSVVIASEFRHLDEDLGATVFYSASNSQDNRDPDNAPVSTLSTNTLKASIKSSNPVRVLRASSETRPFCPRKGIRYDGLYKVTSMSYARNTHGGLYERFQLRRLPDQRALCDIITPTQDQLADLAASRTGY